LGKADTTAENESIATLLLQLEMRRTQQKLGADRHWAIRLDEVSAALITGNVPLSDALARHPDMVRLENLHFLKHIQPSAPATRLTLIRKFLAAAEREPDSPFAPAIFEYIAILPREELTPLLNICWEQQHLRDPVIRLMAASPIEGDQPRFLVGLQSLDGGVVASASEALTRLKVGDANGILVAGIKALRRYPDEKPNRSVRSALVVLLQKVSGEKIGTDEKAWSAWFRKHDPRSAAVLDAMPGFDAAKWRKRSAEIAWERGDSGRGRVIFTRTSCAACHDGGGAVGPSLLGIGKRFSRDDLMTAILQPSKDVSPRYRPTRIVTSDEKAYTGILIYEATDGVILQTGADATVRIAGGDIASKKTVDVSLMPAGLIDNLPDSEIADLMAYLTSLGTTKANEQAPAKR
jgi:putative heme-binding domain-containing protein